MKPKRLGDFAQAKYVERNEMFLGARVTRAADLDENDKEKHFVCDLDSR